MLRLHVLLHQSRNSIILMQNYPIRGDTIGSNRMQLCKTGHVCNTQMYTYVCRTTCTVQVHCNGCTTLNDNFGNIEIRSPHKLFELGLNLVQSPVSQVTKSLHHLTWAACILFNHEELAANYTQLT